VASSDWPEEEAHEEEPEEDHTQASALKFLYEAMNGAWLQSVFTSPPLVAQSSASHRLEYILIGCFFGNGTPFVSKFLNSLMGVPSTENLFQDMKTRLISTENVFFFQKILIWSVKEDEYTS